MGRKAKAAAVRRGGRQGQYHALGNGEDGEDDAVAGHDRSTPSATGPRRSTRRRTRKAPAGTGSDADLRAAILEGGAREIVEVAADGNCLFRALADQLRHDRGAAHAAVRGEVCDFLAAHADEYRHFLVLDDDDAPPGQEDAADFDGYLHKMRQDGEWGGHVELVAAARLYQRGIVVFSSDLDAHRIECGDDAGCGGKAGKTAAAPDMMVSYHDNDHYNSVRDCRMSKPPPVTKRSYAAAVPDDEGDSDDGGAPRKTPAEAAARAEPAVSTAADGGAVDKNAACPCGSGKRYKKCCLAKQRQSARLLARQAAAAKASIGAAEASELPVPSDEGGIADVSGPAADEGNASQCHEPEGDDQVAKLSGAFQVMVL